MPLPNTNHTSTSTRKRTLDDDDDCKTVSVNDTPISSKNTLINTAFNVDVSTNNTPLSPRLPLDSSSALFTCSTPLSSYKTPAKKKRLFTPGRFQSVTMPGSVYVPVSSPTDSELLKADINDSDVFLDESCRLVTTDSCSLLLNGSSKSVLKDSSNLLMNESCRSVYSSSAFLDGNCSTFTDCTPLKSTGDSRVFLNESCKSVVKDSKQLLNESCKSVNSSSVFINGDCSMFTDCTPLKTILENVPVSSPIDSELNKAGNNKNYVFSEGNCSVISDCSPLKTLVGYDVELENSSSMPNNKEIGGCRTLNNKLLFIEEQEEEEEEEEQTSSSEENLDKDVSGIDFL